MRPTRRLHPVLRCVLSLAQLRAWLLCLGLFAYAANAAQAHIYVPGPETVEIRICGLNGGKTVTKTFGGDGPVQLADDSCCGPCLANAAIAPPGLRLPPPGQPRAEPVMQRRGQAPVFTYSIWPGAPPHGPPAPPEG